MQKSTYRILRGRSDPESVDQLDYQLTYTLNYKLNKTFEVRFEACDFQDDYGLVATSDS